MSALHDVRRPCALTGLRAPLPFLRYPILALGPRSEPIHYRGFERGQPFFLSVAPTSPDHGLPTLADGDILIVLTTLLTRHLNAGESLPAVLDVAPATILRALGRPPGGTQHAQIDAALARLVHASINTDLCSAAGNLFSLIDRVERLPGRRRLYRLHLSEFLLQQVRTRHILAFDPAALRLRGLERRLYGWARAYAGGVQYESWSLDLWQARDRAASQDNLRRFRAALTGIAAANRLPGFRVTLQVASKRTKLVLSRLPGACFFDEPSLAHIDQQPSALSLSARTEAVPADGFDAALIWPEDDGQACDLVWGQDD